MNQDKAIFRSKCSALTPKNNEILVHILPFKSAYCLFLIPNLKNQLFIVLQEIIQTLLLIDTSIFDKKNPLSNQ
jgi:hypothetical protein